VLGPGDAFEYLHAAAEFLDLKLEQLDRSEPRVS
jgi:hypothetical protein